MSAQENARPKTRGRPRALSPVQEQLVYAQINATPRGKRCFVYDQIAKQLGVGVSTLEAAVAEIRRKIAQPAQAIDREITAQAGQS